MNIIKKLFSGKTQGKQFVDKWKSNESKAPRPERIAVLGGTGAAGGALVGLAAGGIAAKVAINKVPYQQVTVPHSESVKQREFMGNIPPDDYVRGTWRPSDDGVPTKAVYRDNPVYGANGNPHLRATSTTFRGRGEPQPVKWSTEQIKHHNMNQSDPYNYRTVEDTERYLSHYETVSHTRQVPYSTSESYTSCSPSYNSNGSTSQNCTTGTRSVTRYRSEHYTTQEPVYRDRTVGFFQRYSENIQSRVVGTVEKPHVDFEHGVDVSSYLVKGLLYGAAIGALAGGVTAAMEERFFPDVLPGYEAKPGPQPEPSPKPDPKPTPNPEPGKPTNPPKSHSCGGRQSHYHDGMGQHTHSSANQWHYHGCPDSEGVPNDKVICFKESEVPKCYKEDEPTENCNSNGSVCYVAHD